jgi:hypothetical protein
MPAAVAEKYPNMLALLKRAASRRLKSEWIIIIEMILEFLGPLLEQCFDDAEAFTEVARDPNVFQSRRMERAVLRGLRRDDIGEARYRRARAKQIVDDICAEACEATNAELAKCYADVSD